MTYIIAEIGNMHEGSLPLAKRFAEVAKDCGVDCVKFQSHYFDEESLPSAPNPPYFKDETRKSYFDRTSFSLVEWKQLRSFVENDLGIDFMCSPFSLYALDVLQKAGVKRFKVASGEVTNIPLLKRMAEINGSSVYLSSGMSSYSELELAAKTLTASEHEELVMFQCTSEYPCKPQNVGLNVVKELISRFPDWKIGLSDHTLSSSAAILAMSAGAKVFEKHLTLSNLMYGSDAKNSLEPDLFQKYVQDLREASVILSSQVDKDQAAYDLQEMKITFQKSIVFRNSLNKGDLVTFSDLNYKKPGNGISASRYQEFIGKTLRVDVHKDQVLTEEMFIK